jgi:hypothetical protein
MAIGFLHDTLAFKGRLRIVTPFVFLLLSLLIIPSRVYAAKWFATYGAGVLSGSATSPSIKTTQPSFTSADMFKSALVQPGVTSPTLAGDTFDFLYGGILTSDSYEVREGSSDTEDAYAKNIGVINNSIPTHQRFLDAAIAAPSSCTCEDLLKNCSLVASGKIYKATLECINTAIAQLGGPPASEIRYGNDAGLVVLVQEDVALGSGMLNIDSNIKSSNIFKRLAIVTSRPIKIGTGAGNSNAATQPSYLSQEADIQALLITTYAGGDSDPSVYTVTWSARLKMEGPIISSGKVRFARDGGLYPGVLVQFNPFYITELAKLDKALDIFGSSSERWSYE